MQTTEAIGIGVATPPKPAWLSPWMVGWLLAMVILAATLGGKATQHDFADPDNAMRLVEVRDLLNGQAWFDLTQDRMNPPTGTPMHWARWVDAAIALPIVVMTPLLGRDSAEIVVAFLWPFCLLGAFLYFISQISGRLSEDQDQKRILKISGAVIAALAFPVMDKFAPGSFDHHNVELVLVAGAVWSLIQIGERAKTGWLIGVFLAVAMATAAEALPFVATGALVLGLLWVCLPNTYSRAMVQFGLGLAATSALAFLVLVPPSTWNAPYCDTMSRSFLGIGLVAGGVAAALGGALPAALNRTWKVRLASAVSLGAVASILLFKLFPECSGGGYAALGDDMMTLWMAQIAEARSLVTLANDNPAQFIGYAGPALVGLIAAAVFLVRRPQAKALWILTAFLVSGVVLMIWQVRGVVFAHAFAIPLCALAVVESRAAYRRVATLRHLVVFAVAALASTGAAWAVAGQKLQSALTPHDALAAYSASDAASGECLSAKSLRGLRQVETGVILNQFVLAAGILEATDHSVLSSQYHRNQSGILLSIAAFRSTADGARSIVEASSADYILVCKGLPEARFYARHPLPMDAAGEETLAWRLTHDAPPDWLDPVELGATPMRLYRVRR